jgi:lysine biosynthesis protein LysW
MNEISTEQVITAFCPDCGEKIDLGPQPEAGLKITCPECWAYLEIVNLEPLTLKWDTFGIEDDEDELQNMEEDKESIEWL